MKRFRRRAYVIVVVVLTILLALARLARYPAGRHQGLKPRVSSAVIQAAPASDALNHRGPQLLWTDRFADGTPDFLRLTDPADQAAFRRWFVLIADQLAIRPKGQVPAEVADCASLLRYAYREALKRHDETWFVATGLEVSAPPGEVRAWQYPNTPLGAALFRVRPGPFEAGDVTNGVFAQFADARTLVEHNAFLVSRNVKAAELGDLLFYRQFGQSSPWHSIIVIRIGSEPGIVYDTGPDHGQPGELRRMRLAELLDHPQLQRRPVVSNPNFLGVYRWNILRGTP
jgi:uncharacterized protein YfaT (DUF1175 family)